MPFLTSALGGGEWSTFAPAAVLPEGTPLNIEEEAG